MIELKVNGEEVFRINGKAFAVVSPDAFTLNYSADGENFTAWGAETPALENLQVINFAPGTYFKLVGNTSTVTVTY